MAAANGQMSGTRRTTVRCAIYTRKSTEEGLEQEFKTLDAQRDAAEDFIRSQRGEGWSALPEHYDDGGFTGANMERPALQKLLQDARDGLVDCVMVYRVDRRDDPHLHPEEAQQALPLLRLRERAPEPSVRAMACSTASIGLLSRLILDHINSRKRTRRPHSSDPFRGGTRREV